MIILFVEISPGDWNCCKNYLFKIVTLQ